MGHSPCGHKESDTTEQITLSLFHFTYRGRQNCKAIPPRSSSPDNLNTNLGIAVKELAGGMKVTHQFSLKQDSYPGLCGSQQTVENS